jgi:ketosteroid isomerase-like protein
MPESSQSILLSALEAAVGVKSRDLSELFTDDVKGWSPTLHVSSLAELKEEFAERSDALSNISLTLDSLDVVGAKAMAEWRLAADHTGPLVLDEDLLVEATGRRVELAGATFVEFRDGRIHAFRNYFDDAALLEQLLIP